MKVTAPSEALRFVNQVHEKQDGEGHPDGHRQHSGNSPHDHPEQPKDHFEVTDEQVNAAIHAFGTDAQAQANGLSASRTGQGPGLKVVLRDTEGAVVRQFTGEEFLRLREAATAGRKGKILDQKL